MSKPKVYDLPIPTTNSSVQGGNGDAKSNGKIKARYPHGTLGISQAKASGGMKTRAHTPGGPAGS